MVRKEGRPTQVTEDTSKRGGMETNAYICNASCDGERSLAKGRMSPCQEKLLAYSILPVPQTASQVVEAKLVSERTSKELGK